MSLVLHHGPRRGQAFAAMLAVAAGGWLIMAGADAPPAANTAPAASAPGPAANAGDLGATPEYNYQNLENFINLPPERLAQMIKMLQDLQKMTPGDKAALQNQIRMRVQSIQQVEMEIRPDLRQLSPGDGALLRAYTRVLLIGEAQDWGVKLRAATTPDQRKAVIQLMLADARKRGIVVPPTPVNGRGGPPGGPRGGQGQGGPRGVQAGRGEPAPDAVNRGRGPENETKEVPAATVANPAAANP